MKHPPSFWLAVIALAVAIATAFGQRSNYLRLNSVSAPDTSLMMILRGLPPEPYRGALLNAVPSDIFDRRTDNMTLTIPQDQLVMPKSQQYQFGN